MAQFDPDNVESDELGWVVALRKRLSECESFQAFTGKPSPARALPHIYLGVGPIPWDKDDFTAAQLADAGVIAVIEPDHQSESQEVEDSISAAEDDPDETATATLKIWRHVRDSEWMEDETGQDIFMRLWDLASQIGKQLYTKSNSRSTTNPTGQCPKVRRVTRLAQGFTALPDQVGQGRSFVVVFRIEMGSNAD